MNAFRRLAPSSISIAILVVLLIVYLAAALIGIDFGRHYDEFYFADAMKAAITEFDLFHGHYTYGGLYFVPGFVYLIVDAWPDVQAVRDALAAHPVRPVDLSTMPSAAVLATTATSIVESDDFILHMRMIFAAISALSIIWVYLAARVIFPDSYAAALLGAAFLALSWEVGYHARFVAPDTMMMQFAALQLLFLAKFARSRTPAAAIAWMMLAAVAGGLGVGVKMTGVFLALPIGMMLAFPHGGAAAFDWRGRLALIAGTAAAFLASWIMTSPGPLWDGLHFAGHLDYEWLNYTQLPADHPYRVDGFAQRLVVFGVWLSSALASPYAFIAIPMAVIAIGGGVVLGRVVPMLILGIVTFALVYMIFLAQHRGVYIRNLLVLSPIVALMFGAGCRYIISAAVERAAVWWTVVTVALFAIIMNTTWLFSAALSVDETTRDTILRDFKDWAEADDERRLMLSPGLVEALGSDIASLLRCEAQGLGVDDPTAVVAMFYREQSWRDWKANQPGFVERVFASREINYTYAPSWEGKQVAHRIVVITRERLTAMGADATAFRRCRVRDD